MPKQTNSPSPSEPPEPRISALDSFKKYGLPFLAGLLAPVVILGIEYWTGWFQPVQAPDAAPRVSLLTLLAYTALCLWCLFASIGCLKNWLIPRRLFREEFALQLLIALALFGALTVITWRTDLTPMILLSVWSDLMLNRNLPSPAGDARDLAIMGLSWVLLMIVANSLHGNWRGPRSLQQLERETQGARLGLLGESLTQLWRVVRGGPALRHQADRASPTFRRRDEPIIENPPWSDLALDLITLSTSSYQFGESSWHDREECWVGSNLDTGGLVLLYPVLAWPDDETLRLYATYATKLPAYATVRSVEILIIHQGTVTAPARRELTPDISCTFFSEEVLLDQLVDFAEYRAQIQRRVEDKGHTMPPGSPVDLTQVYIPTGFVNYRTGEHGDDVESHLKHWLRDPRPCPKALLGHYGQGKSSTALMLTYHLLQEPDLSRWPILIELRGKSPGDLSPQELLGAWIGTRRNSRMTPAALYHLHQAGRLLLIFEGFDEMSNLGGREQRMRHFETLGHFAAHPRAKVLITGRPNLFESDDELEQALGIDQPFGVDGEAVELAYFTPEQIERSLDPYNQTVRTQIVGFARSNLQFYDLIRRPALLHIVANIWEQERLADQVATLTSARVMELFIKRSYLRQGLKDTPRRYMFLNTSERAYFMSGVAARMAADDLPNQITGEQLNETIDALLKEIPEEVSTQLSAYQGEMKTALSLRIADTPDALDLLRTDVRTYGLLQDDPSRPGSYRFGHKAFMEYLFADVAFQHMQEPKQRSPRFAAITRTIRPSLSALAQMPVSCAFLADMVRSQVQGIAEIRHAAPALQSEYKSRFILFSLRRLMSNSDFSLGFLSINLVLTLVGMTLTSNPRRVRRLMFGLSVIFLLTSFYLAFTLFFRPDTINSSPLSRLIMMMMAMMALMTVTMVMAMHLRSIRLSDSSASSNIRLLGTFTSLFIVWVFIARELGADDEALKRASGIARLPWTKHDKFDYFPSPRERSASGKGKPAQQPWVLP